MIDISKVHQASFMPGLTDLGTIDLNFDASFSVPGLGSTTKTFVVPFKRSDVLSNIRIMFTGSNHIDNIWIPIFGPTFIFDSVYTPNFSHDASLSYTFTVYVKSHPLGRQIVMFIANNGGLTMALPNLVMNVHAHVYEYPF